MILEIMLELKSINAILKAMQFKIDKAAPVWEGAAWGTAGDLDRVKRTVETAFGLPEKSIDRQTRSQDVCWPRQVAMYLIRDIHVLPFERIAAAFGKRDHGTAMNACQLVSERIATNTQVKTKVNMIRATLAARALQDKQDGIVPIS